MGYIDANGYWQPDPLIDRTDSLDDENDDFTEGDGFEDDEEDEDDWLDHWLNR